ncbi:MAG TPA: hypothetical protein VG299_00295 [Candidatus Dormibacteraeota bacterium]|jgi:hypothetical protein|nr:hypothetical protein [Candidatus Dormibacteraeota bacterium]
MTEMLSSGEDRVSALRVRERSLRRRRRFDLRGLAMGVALFVAVAWTIVFGVGIVLR